jgi:nitronate monooxygenase
LAAAVSTAGGLGMIGVGSTTAPATIADEARVAEDAGQPFGIGLMGWALQRAPEQLDAAITARPALISISFGDCSHHVARLHDAGILLATQVGTVGEAREAVDAGVDVIVARGAEAGGHGLSQIATLPLLQAVLDEVGDVPVLAAGGISTGRGLAAVLAAGAAGAWIGTAFLACPEAANDPAARARLCAADGTETLYTRVFDIAQQIPWPEQYPGRALANRFTDRWHGHEEALAADPDAASQLAAAKSAADYQIAYLYAGQGVGTLTAERPAAEVIASLAQQAEQLLLAR